MKYALFASLLILFCGAIGGAIAAPGAVKISSTEDVVIAFYKTGGAIPPFEKWIKLREPYRTTPVARRPAMMEQEKQRLQSLYAGFDPSKDLLSIKTQIIARTSAAQNPDDPEKTDYRLNMKFSVGDAHFFPYDFIDERFAVIPQEIQEHLNPFIIKEQYEYLSQQLGKGKPVTLIMELRPVKADMEAPFDMDGTGGGINRKDGKGQWMFLTDIASMSVWNKNGSLLWEYTAPWYVTPMRENLLNLYEDKKEN